MTEIAVAVAPDDVDQLVVLGGLRELVAAYSADERPQLVHIPRGDALYWVIAGEKIFVAKPSPGEDLDVQIEWNPDAPELKPHKLAPIMRYFSYDHLPEGPLRDVSMRLCYLAAQMEGSLPDGPEKSAGLRKLLEAKDCFVRAALN